MMTASEKREVERLRYEARLAFLDGRTKRSKELNNRADAMLRNIFGPPLREAVQEWLTPPEGER
jgi:hypothetical protein